VELEDAEEVPPVFVAVEVKVYAVPLVNPDTTQDPDAPVTVHVFPAKTPEESEA
jgi:predicted component of type VI protein secretion system